MTRTHASPSASVTTGMSLSSILSQPAGDFLSREPTTGSYIGLQVIAAH